MRWERPGGSRQSCVLAGARVNTIVELREKTAVQMAGVKWKKRGWTDSGSGGKGRGGLDPTGLGDKPLGKDPEPAAVELACGRAPPGCTGGSSHIKERKERPRRRVGSSER